MKLLKNFKYGVIHQLLYLKKKDNRLYLKIKKKIDMAIVNQYLNKLSGYLSKAGLLQKRLLKIEQRFKQYQYFIS